MRIPIHSFFIRASLVGMAVGVSITALQAGDLNPPAGPVTGTMKPLTEVEPRIAINDANTPGDSDSVYKILSPGSYYLTGNVSAASGESGIEIGASGVTLDLMGFEINGAPGSFQGVRVVVGGTRNITIKTGSIRNFSGGGINANLARNMHVDRVQVASITAIGINVLNGLLTDCLVTSCTVHGIVAGAGSTVVRCTSQSNQGDGISVGLGSVVGECLAESNEGFGIIAADGTTISNSRSGLNGRDGFSTGTGALLKGCTADTNVGHGFFVNAGATLTGCTAHGNNGDGFSAGSLALSPGFGFTFSECTAEANTTHGFVVGGRGTISGCTASSNGRDGIQVGDGCHVSGNEIHGNGTSTSSGAGIRATGSGNRIDGNNVGANDIGILLGAAGNFMVRNSARGNSTNYDFSGLTQTSGEIVTATGVISPSVSPWANFSY